MSKILLFLVVLFCYTLKENNIAVADSSSHYHHGHHLSVVKRPLRTPTMAPGFAYSRHSLPKRVSSLNKNVTQTRKYGVLKCTARYWTEEGKEVWPVNFLPLRSTVAKVFGSEAAQLFGQDMTLADAMAPQDENNKHDGYRKLLRQSSAALINAYTRQGYPYKAWRIKTLFIRSLSSHDVASAQAAQFRSANLACSGLSSSNP